jgi:hypothetical protein
LTAELFDRAAYSDAIRALVGQPLWDHEWSYPPSVLLFAVPLSVLPLVVAYGLWTSGTLATLWAALRAGGMPSSVCLAVVTGPAALLSAWFGQNGALSGALLAGGLLMVGRRPVAAGVLLGLLSFKPHLGILLPVVFLASRDWRALGVTIATAAALIVVSGALFGFSTWAGFVNETEPLMRTIMEAPYPGLYQRIEVTIFVAARANGLGLPAAYAVQAIAAACCAVLVWRAWRQPDIDSFARMAVTVALSLLASPYCYIYDMVALSAGIAAMAWRDGWRMDPLLAVAWLWPCIQRFFTPVFGFPVGAFVIAATAWVAWRRLEQGRPSAQVVTVPG